MATKGASNHFGNARHGKQGHITSHIGFAWAKGFNKLSVARHAKEHMSSLGLSNENEYVAHAVAFANHVDREKNISYVRKNGQTVKYSTKTNEFAVIDKHGFVTTYFKPDNGISYYYNDRRKNSK